MNWKETPEKPRDNTVTSRQGKISIGKGPSKSMLLTFEHCHKAMGHLSLMQMERVCKYMSLKDFQNSIGTNYKTKFVQVVIKAHRECQTSVNRNQYTPADAWENA